jgi:hypothetical protein
MKDTNVISNGTKPAPSFFHNSLPGIIFIVWMAGLIFGKAPVFGDPDTGWHLAAGDLIRQTHQLPAKDPWSFTAGDTYWYNISWLFDVTVSWINSWGGLHTLYALDVLVFALLAAVMARFALRQGAGMIAVLIVCMPTLLLVYGGVLLRPNLVSAVMMVAFYIVLAREAGGAKKHGYWLLPLLMAVWANCHGGAVGGFVLIGVYELAALLQRDRQAEKRLVIQGVLCMVALTANPYGADVVTAMLRTLSSPFSKNYLIEWRSLNVGDKAHSAMTAFVVMCIWLAPFTRRAIPLAERLLLGVWLAMALLSIRHSIILGIISIPVLSRSLTEWLQETRWAGVIRARDEEYRRDLTQPGARVGIYACCAVWVLFVLSPYPLSRLVPESKGFTETQVPTAEMNYINTHYPNARFYNDYNLGGYMIYGGRGQPKLFVDGRADTVYPLKVTMDYIRMLTHGGFDPEAKKLFRDYKIDGLILADNFSTLALFKENPDWKQVFSGPAGKVFIRAGLEAREITPKNAK